MVQCKHMKEKGELIVRWLNFVVHLALCQMYVMMQSL